jgi:hypothetical protein
MIRELILPEPAAKSALPDIDAVKARVSEQIWR